MENDDIKIWANSIREDLPRMRGHQNSDTGIIIPRVPERLRLGENDPYEPQIISFGPYHHGKPSLQAMEKYKWRYLEAILRRNLVIPLEHYINMMKEQEMEIRSWYPDCFDNNISKEFVKMMLLDGCFVVEYLLRFSEGVLDELDSMHWMHGQIVYDILLLENQIPFFILNKIFELLPDTPSSLTGLATSYLNRMTGEKIRVGFAPPESFHLLHLYHSLCLYTPEVGVDSTTNIITGNGVTSERSAEVSNIDICINIITGNGVTSESSAEVSKISIPSATVLQEGGIKFVKEEKECSSLDVTFSNGKMKIPPLLINADTKSRLRNLVIFEQFYPNFRSAKNFSSFVHFINCLVTTPEHVALLNQEDIIRTSYGNKYAAGLLSQLNRGTTVRPDQHYLASMYLEVNKYWQSRKNKWRAIFIKWRNWRASLIDNYFSSPWKTLGIVSGGFLLLLTLLQTIFSGYSTL